MAELVFIVDGSPDTAKRNQPPVYKTMEQLLAGLINLLFQDGGTPLVGSKDRDLIRRLPDVEGVVLAEGKVRLNTLQPVKRRLRLEPGKRPVDAADRKPPAGLAP